MIGERLKEIIEFFNSESPYRSANKGWVTDDVYLQWGQSIDASKAERQEFAKIAIFWNPIAQIVAALFMVICLATVFVFISSSLSAGKSIAFLDSLKQQLFFS